MPLPSSYKLDPNRPSPPNLLFNSNMHPDNARFVKNRFKLPPIPPARNDSSWKPPRLPFKLRSTQESRVLPPLFLSVTETSGSSSSNENGEDSRNTSLQAAAESDRAPRQVFARPKVHHHDSIGARRPFEVPCMPRRLPFRPDAPQGLPFQRTSRVDESPWNALLGVASAEIQAQPTAISHPKPRQPTVVRPCLVPFSPILTSPPRAQVFHACSSSPIPGNHASIGISNRIDPAIAKASRARRLATRRNAAKLKRQREVSEKPNRPPVPLPHKTVVVPRILPATPVKSGKPNENNRRRLANRASVQKCRNKQKIRCKKLHAERDLLSEENKILKTLRDEINASGILKLKVATAITAEGKQFLRNYGGLVADPIHVGGNTSHRTASGHAYHRNGNHGAILQRFGSIPGNMANNNNNRDMQIRTLQNGGRLYMHRRSEDIRNEQNPVLEHAFDGRNSNHPLPVLPALRDIPCKGSRADVRSVKMNHMFDNLSIESSDDSRDASYIKHGHKKDYNS